MALIRITIALVCTLSLAAVASATPLTLQFTGHWQHYDPQLDQPGFWSDMAGLGIVNGTQALFTFSVDDAVSGSDPSHGVYAVTGWRLHLGQYTFANTTRPSFLSAGGFWGPSSGAALGKYSPGFMQFGLGTSGLPVHGGLSSLALAPWINTVLYFDFNSPFSRNGGTIDLHLVPGPATLPIVLSGAAVGFVWRLRRRRRDSVSSVG